VQDDDDEINRKNYRQVKQNGLMNRFEL